VLKIFLTTKLYILLVVDIPCTFRNNKFPVRLILFKKKTQQFMLIRYNFRENNNDSLLNNDKGRTTNNSGFQEIFLKQYGIIYDV
jgi:hypothetical protein